jgi:hypothetical protein
MQRMVQIIKDETHRVNITLVLRQNLCMIANWCIFNDKIIEDEHG